MDTTIVTQPEPEEKVQLTEKKLFTQDHIQAMLWVVAALGGLTVLLVFFSLVLFKNVIRPAQVYFQATEQKQIIPEIPLDKPGIESNVLLSWIVEGMNTAHTFNFMNYERRMKKAQEYFSREGYQDYTQALNSSGIIQAIVQNKWVMIAMPLEVPEILKEGTLGNRYLWRIKLPVQFNYRNINNPRTVQFDLNLLVVRVPTTESPNGVTIYKYELLPPAPPTP